MTPYATPPTTGNLKSPPVAHRIPNGANWLLDDEFPLMNALLKEIAEEIDAYSHGYYK